MLGLVVFALTLSSGVSRYGPEAMGGYLAGGLINGAIIYAVASVVLVAWRKLRGVPLHDRPSPPDDPTRTGWR